LSERKCPICGQPAGARPQNPFGPFCSDRCRLVDLGSWLGGSYRIAGDPVDGQDAEGPPGDKPQPDRDDD
jgi:uncharacterized protein